MIVFFFKKTEVKKFLQILHKVNMLDSFAKPS